MNCLFVTALFVAGSMAVPLNYGATLAAGPVAGYAAHGPVAAVAYGAPSVSVAESIHAGPAVATTQVHHGVVGHRAVQVGSQQVQVGSEYFVAGQDLQHQPGYTYVAEPAKVSQSTVAIPEPVLPYAAPVLPVIPPAPTNQGPAPIDTVTQERVLAPVRTHTQITPRRTQIVPELQVNQVPYDVPVAIPVPVEREVIVEKHVQRPYQVDVPRAVPVAAPYKVHPVQEVVHTPVVHKNTVSYHHAPTAIAGHAIAGPAAYAATPALAYAH